MPRRFAVQVTIARAKGAWSEIHTVPTFLLDADTHGLWTRADAERFARVMFLELVNPHDGLSITAEEV